MYQGLFYSEKKLDEGVTAFQSQVLHTLLRSRPEQPETNEEIHIFTLLFLRTVSNIRVFIYLFFILKSAAIFARNSKTNKR